LAACLHDPRQPGKITHRLDEILRFRMLAMVIPTAMTCCAAIPSSKWRCTGLGTGTVLAANRLAHREHAAAPGALSHGDARPVLRQFPDRHLTLDLDESFDRGEQELRKFNAYYDDFLPIHIFDTSGRLVVSVLREAATPSDPGPGQAGGRPSVRAVPAGPDPSARRQPLCLSGSDELVRGQGHRVHLRPGRNRSPGGASPDARSPHGGALCRTAEPPKFKLRRYMDFRGKSWNCQRRIVARVEAGPDGVDTRYIVTNLTDRRAQRLYERKYCQRGRTC
jgi:hypothetical protein